MFATRQSPQALITSQLDHRNLIDATLTDRTSLFQLPPSRQPPVSRHVISRQ
jgi:hypothetical protein